MRQICESAPEKVDNKNSVLLLLQIDTLLIIAVGQTGFTALHIAAKDNRWELVELLLAAKAEVDAKSKVGAGCG